MNMLSALLGQGSFGQMEGMTEINTNKSGVNDDSSVYNKKENRFRFLTQNLIHF